MNNTENQMSSTSSIPKDFPETVETFADVLRMLGAERLEEEMTPDMEEFAVHSSQRILEEKGKEYIWQNRHFLKYQLEYLATM